MGARGPIPKRSDALHGHRSKAELGTASSALGASAVPVPEPDERWHPMARDWFSSLAKSGQCAYFQPSDWATARVWAEVLSRQLAAERMSAVMIQAWASAAGELLTTEGARRRCRLELVRHGVRDVDEQASVTALAGYRAALARDPLSVPIASRTEPVT